MKSLLLLALLSTPALAAPLATLTADLDGDSLADQASLTPIAGQEWLRLEVKLGSGKTIVSTRLIRSLRETALSATPFGLLISSVEDQSSHSKAYDYTLAIEGGKAELTIFNFEFSYPSRSDSCHVTPGSGLALVNGDAFRIRAKKQPLPAASGAELEDICHQLLIGR